jgi:hypothetical protein
MKDGLKYLVGKRICGVVVASSKQGPNHQVFLLFPDGTRFEFWGENFSCCSGLDKAEGIDRYVAGSKGEIRAIYDEPLGSEDDCPLPLRTYSPPAAYQVQVPASLTGRMKMDLEAWRLAKAIIAAAAKR